MIRANGMTARHSPRGGWLGLMATVLLASRVAVAAGEGVFDVRAHGAAGDGKTLDTAAINKAVETCAQVGAGHHCSRANAKSSESWVASPRACP